MAAMLDELDRRIVQVLVGSPQSMNRGKHRPARAQMPLTQRIANRGHAIVRVEKCQQRIELHGRPCLFCERAQLPCRGDSGLAPLSIARTPEGSQHRRNSLRR